MGKLPACGTSRYLFVLTKLHYFCSNSTGNVKAGDFLQQIITRRTGTIPSGATSSVLLNNGDGCVKG